MGVVRVAKRIVVEVVVRLVRVVGEFGRQQDTRLVRRVKILRLFIVGVHAHVVEPRRLQHLQVRKVKGLVRRRDASCGIHGVVAAASDVKRLVIQVEILVAHFELADAKSLKPRMEYLAI